MLVDEVILQHSDRGMDILQKLYPKQHCKEAVEHFVKLEKGTVFLYTGFWVAGFCETDGPIGTYFLARALNSLGYKAVIITDDFCKDFFREIECVYMPISGYSEEENQKLLDEYNPIAHISIERCGLNANGKYENARSFNIAEFTAPVDELFMLGDKTKPTYAIGDGGNEVGMGNFRKEIVENLSLVPCVVCCDFPIIASVSNWGAYGFIAYLQKHFEKKIIPSFEEVDEYLGYIVSLGSVDGIKKECVKSVDGKEWSIEKEILDGLNEAIKV
jgi:nitrate reductase NapE component